MSRWGVRGVRGPGQTARARSRIAPSFPAMVSPMLLPIRSANPEPNTPAGVSAPGGGGPAAGDGMDGVRDVDAPLLQQVGELAHLVLRLRDGEPVARDDTTRCAYASITATSSAVVARTDAPSTPPPSPAGPGDDLAEGAEEHVRDRAVHRLAHQHRQQGSRGADERAAHDQDVGVQDEAGRGGREPGERVQQRDDDRHVGAADRQDEQDRRTARAAPTITGEDPELTPAIAHAAERDGRRRRARR